jgi:hypothetical protein
MSTKKTITDVLSTFQSELKAPKNQENKFGKYKYRSSEDILEGLKPLITAQKASVILSDSIEIVGSRIYVKATATLNYDGENISVSAFAREPEQQKGMSEPQITGSASSYARKYALNGLFAIDDTKDNDHESMSANYQADKPVLISDKQHQEIRVKLQNKRIDYQSACMDWGLKNFGELFVSSLPNLDEYINNATNNAS